MTIIFFPKILKTEGFKNIFLGSTAQIEHLQMTVYHAKLLLVNLCGGFTLRNLIALSAYLINQLSLTFTILFLTTCCRSKNILH